MHPLSMRPLTAEMYQSGLKLDCTKTSRQSETFIPRNGEEVKLPSATTNTYNGDVLFCDFPKPVYVIKTDEGEQLIYRTSEMELDKEYHVKWYDDHHVLIRRKDKVEFFKFFPS